MCWHWRAKSCPLEENSTRLTKRVSLEAVTRRTQVRVLSVWPTERRRVGWCSVEGRERASRVSKVVEARNAASGMPIDVGAMDRKVQRSAEALAACSALRSVWRFLVAGAGSDPFEGPMTPVGACLATTDAY